jgi:hypothetical protein
MWMGWGTFLPFINQTRWLPETRRPTKPSNPTCPPPGFGGLPGHLVRPVGHQGLGDLLDHLVDPLATGYLETFQANL